MDDGVADLFRLFTRCRNPVGVPVFVSGQRAVRVRQQGDMAYRRWLLIRQVKAIASG